MPRAAITIGARGRVRRQPHFRVLAKDGIIWSGYPVPCGEVLVAEADGAHVKRWLREGKIGRITLGTAPIAGICFICGCTWTRACPGGCSWANKARTLCSSCK